MHDGAVRATTWVMGMDDRQWFFNAPAQVAVILFGGLTAVVGLSGLLLEASAGGRAWGASMLTFGLVLGGRSVIAPTVEVNPKWLVLRSVLRTRKVAWAEIDDITIDTGITGPNSGEREYLVVQLKDSTQRRHKELNAPVGRKHRSPCRVHEALKASIRELRRQRSLDGE